MQLLSAIVTHFSPIFLATSPITSYVDQIYSIHRSRSSAGFALDIPLIMLVASITKVFYWFGTHYDTSLLVQACVMIVMQTLLLHIALANRSSDANIPFAAPKDGVFGFSKRPYDFWQWKSERPYWSFLAYFTLALIALQYLFGQWQLYISTIGYLALTIEATLPLPQILSNHRNRSCRGFRLSVLINWLIGDVMKISFFFLSTSTIPWAFKLCGLFQFACDIYLGVQYLQFERQSDVNKILTEKIGFT